MYMLLFLLLIAIIYIVTFKENFSKEHMDKVAGFLAIIAIIWFILSLLLSIMQG